LVAGPANTPLQLVWGVTNQGPGTALAPWPEVVYLSTNSVLNEQTDTLIYFGLQSRSVPAGGVLLLRSFQGNPWPPGGVRAFSPAVSPGAHFAGSILSV
jgi:hypothetical protein